MTRSRTDESNDANGANGRMHAAANGGGGTRSASGARVRSGKEPQTSARVRSRVRSLTMCAVLAAVALALSYAESLIPLPAPVPGMKPGFANIAIVVALYLLGGRRAFAVNVLRIALAGLMFSGVFAMFYALAGGISAMLAMVALKRTGAFSVIGVSVGGSAAHITGQIVLASLIIRRGALFAGLPIFLISAVAGGVIVGLIAHLLLRALPRRITE